MKTGSMIVISKNLLKQINGGTEGFANTPDGIPKQELPVSLHGSITPNGVYDLGVNIMLTPQVGIGTTITSTENVSKIGASIFFRL